MQPLRMRFVQLLMCTSFITLYSGSVAASVFSQVGGRAESLPPLPTEEEVAAQEQELREAQQPKPLVKQDIPQRIEKVTPQTFMILPREVPLPTGTLAEGFFIEETGEAPPPPEVVQDQLEFERLQAEAAKAAQAAEMKAKAAQKAKAEAIKAQAKQTEKQKEKPKAPKKAPAPRAQEFTSTLAYKFDFRAPASAEALDKLQAKLKDKKIQSLEFTVSGTTPPLRTSLLWEQRVHTLKQLLQAKDIEHKLIFNNKEGPQSLTVRAIFSPFH